MKLFRAVFIVAFIAFALFQAGCRNTWTVDFTKAVDADLAQWESNGSWSLNDEPGTGLYAYWGIMTAPVGFTGDFTLTLEMYIDVDASNDADFTIRVGDDYGEEPEHYISCEFTDAGDIANEEVLIHEDGAGLDFRDVDTVAPIDGFKSGINVFKMDKRGNNVKITLNGHELKSFTIECYDGNASYPAFWTTEYSNVNVQFRKISVSYEGDPVPFP